MRRARSYSIVLLALAAILAGCGGGKEKQFEGVSLEAQDPGPIHVHGLGFDPDTKTLYIATHTGLWKLADGEAKARRITDRRQDTMGFTVVRPGFFLGSGHPDLREAQPDIPPLLGLIKSTDGGQSWHQISLVGRADFHILRTAGKRIYGYDSTNNVLMRSDDAGKSWRKEKVPEPLLDLVVDPADASHLVASGEVALYQSDDRGETWHVLEPTPGFLAWPRRARLYRFDSQGEVEIAAGAGKRFRRVGSIGGTPEAVLAAGHQEFYAALHGGVIKHSRDSGRTWQVRAQP